MRIINLMENTEGENNCLYEHGLSIYIETKKHKILVDTGASPAFLENAKIHNIDISDVDMVFLSHGHYDHSGGLMDFAKVNGKAIIYMQANAGDEFYHKNDSMEKYIGIEKDILKLPQVKLLSGNVVIDEGISVFSGIKGRRHFPSGNLELMVKVDSGLGDGGMSTFIQDDFSHEQCLVLFEDEKTILISGCAHNGILNILDEYRRLYGANPDIVISGFHLMKKIGYSLEDIENTKAIANELKDMDTIFYTGHCTGIEPFGIMKEIMGDRLIYVHSGDMIYDQDKRLGI